MTQRENRGVVVAAVSPRGWQRFHAASTVVWAILILPTLLFWRDSVLFVGIVSCYANAVGHFSAYQGSRAENASSD